MHRCVRRCRGEPALTETYRAPAQTEALDRDRDARHRLLTFLSVAVFVGLVGWWGDETLADGRVLNLGAPPFYGAWRSDISRVSRELWWPASAVVLATLVLVPTWWTHAVRRIRWGLVLVGSWAWALVWSVSLAATSGVERIAEPLLDSRYEYLPLARELEDPGAFVSTFVEQLSSRPTHVRGHPPGAVLAFWGLDKVFATDLRLALAVIAIGALAAPASVVAVRALGDEAQARRVAVFAGLAPAAVWMATSADALFTGVIAISIAMGAVGWAATGRSAAWWSLGAGVLAGAALALSWGAPLLVGPLLVLWVVLLTQRRWTHAAAMASGALAIPVLLMLGGFDWVAGSQAVQEEYYAGVGSSRPRVYFVFANLAAFAVAVGPAGVGSVASLRHRRLWWLVGGALGGVLLADLSGLSKGEVERIWLPAVPWILVATASVRRRREQAIWTLASMLLAVLIEWRLLSPW